MDSAMHQRIVTGLQSSLEQQYGAVTRIETHISSLLITPEYTYKIKKPLNLGFLDFSNLKQRAFYCQEEVRLNGRLAPATYLRVVPIIGPPDQPILNGLGESIEYAVEMRTFASSGLLSQYPEQLSESIVEALAEQLAAFHQSIAPASEVGEFGSPEAVIKPMLENFSQIEYWTADASQVSPLLDHLHHWTQQQFEHLSPLLVQRKQSGFIRECHGDLHLGNITLDDGQPLIFDGIEFNPDLRWIDVASELAFLVMDLDERGYSALGYRFLNHYLELSGDYALLPLLCFYKVYRAMVRAKISAIRLAQVASGEERSELSQALSGYLKLANHYTKPHTSALVITRGFSGSGKSWYCRNQLKDLPAVVVRSDVERKRLAGISVGENSCSELDGGIYRAEFSRRTYSHLLDCAVNIMSAGLIAVVDATFLSIAQRKLFIDYAETQSITMLILDFDLPEEVLCDRIQGRLKQGGDPSEADLAVLQKQLIAAESLTRSERQKAVCISEQSKASLPYIYERLGLKGGLVD